MTNGIICVMGRWRVRLSYCSESNGSDSSSRVIHNVRNNLAVIFLHFNYCIETQARCGLPITVTQEHIYIYCATGNEQFSFFSTSYDIMCCK